MGRNEVCFFDEKSFYRKGRKKNAEDGEAYLIKWGTVHPFGDFKSRKG